MLAALLLLSGAHPTKTYGADPITISAVGDIMMGSTYPKKMLPPDDGSEIFLNVKDELRQSSIVFGNLEGPLIDGGRASKCKKGSADCYEFRTPTRYVRLLKDAGFNVLNIANNHSSDFGLDGIESTVKTLNSADIKAVGGNLAAYFSINGKRIAVAGFSTSYSNYSYPVDYSYSILNILEAMRIVSDLKKSNDIVIVSFHGGAEGRAAQHVLDKEEIFAGEMRGNVKRFSRSVIDAGADMVIGHGPHVLRALEIYKGHLIAYSMGNFLTYERFNISGPNGLSVILKAEIDPENGNFISGRLIPLKLLNGGIPEIDPEGEAIKLLRELAKEDLISPNIILRDDGELLPEAP